MNWMSWKDIYEAKNTFITVTIYADDTAIFYVAGRVQQ
jgi:hypothetical protein